MLACACVRVRVRPFHTVSDAARRERCVLRFQRMAVVAVAAVVENSFSDAASHARTVR